MKIGKRIRNKISPKEKAGSIPNPCKNIKNKEQIRTNHRKVKSSDLYLLAPQIGLEPMTPRLTAACSTD